MDGQLSQMAAENKTHSGCTAVAAFLRIEDAQQGQSFLSAQQQSPQSIPNQQLSEDNESDHSNSAKSPSISSSSQTKSVTTTESGRTTPSSMTGGGSRIRNAVRSLTSKLSTKSDTTPPVVRGSKNAPFEPDWNLGLRKVLYAANAGDARAVLCRAGEALRLTYDHKGSDAQESKRITDAGGFVMNNRVNGELNVSSCTKRSLNSESSQASWRLRDLLVIQV